MLAPSRFSRDIARLFYPHTCLGCGYEMYHLQQYLCAHCIRQLPVTGFEASQDNYIAHMFAGRLPVQKAAAWLFFGKDGLTQTLVHHLKYKSNLAL
ncbi:MAG TPA: hypothetical protein VK907_11820, partial [Phnomibacter sp.]|nr:hypothetical protein [Phnomibacter sp.]